MRSRSKTPTISRLAALAAVAALVPAGWSTPASGDSTPAPAAATAASDSLLPPAEGTTEYPLTLATLWGETVLEARPERIVALGTTDVELLAALGVTPVATQNTLERALWAQEALPGEIEKIYDWLGVDGGMPYEEVAASRPDLIIVTGFDLSDSFDRLATVAPVLGLESEGDPDGGALWRTDIQRIGHALDLADAATAATEQYDSFFEQVRADNPEFQGLTATFLLQYGEQYGTFYETFPGTDAAQLFLDLGFAPNPLAEQFANDWGAVSPELISQVDADVLIVAAANPDPDDVARLLTGTELFQRLGAVERGNWAIFYSNADGSGYVFDGVEHPGNINWALAHGGALLGKPWAVEQLIPILRDALDLD